MVDVQYLCPCVSCTDVHPSLRQKYYSLFDLASKIAALFNVTEVRSGDPWRRELQPEPARASSEPKVLHLEDMGELTRERYGEMAWLAGEPRNATVRTVSPSELYSLSQADFRHLLEGEPEASKAISETV